MHGRCYVHDIKVTLRYQGVATLRSGVHVTVHQEGAILRSDIGMHQEGPR